MKKSNKETMNEPRKEPSREQAELATEDILMLLDDADETTIAEVRVVIENVWWSGYGRGVKDAHSLMDERFDFFPKKESE